VVTSKAAICGRVKTGHMRTSPGTKVKVFYSPVSRLSSLKIVLGMGRRFLQNAQWLAKRKRALLESNPPGITNRELIKTMSAGVAAKSRPLFFAFIGLIDSPMPQKTHCFITLTFVVSEPAA
jgi:hypothetical protein